MRILITGGTGLIGRRLCAALLETGHELTVLSRHPETVAQRCGNGVTPLASLSEWQPELHFDAVINLAGEPIVDKRWTQARKQRLWESRVTLTEQLVERIHQAREKPRVLLSGSATGYYGDTGDCRLDETVASGDDFGARLCAAWEQAAQQAQSPETRVCLLRTGLVLDASGGLLGRMLLPFKLGLGARLGNGKQWMSWIHMDDYIAIALRLLNQPDASGPYNMTAPLPVTNREFTAQLGRALHRPAWWVAPALLLRPLLGERSVLLLGGQRALPIKVQAMGYRYAYPALEGALAALLS